MCSENWLEKNLSIAAFSDLPISYQYFSITYIIKMKEEIIYLNIMKNNTKYVLLIKILK